MQTPDLFLVFLRPLNRLGLSYMVTGAAAAVIYGVPRMTHDIDLVLELPKQRVDDFERAFPADRFYCPPEEVLHIESKRRFHGHFNLIHHETGFKADIYLTGADPLHRWAMAQSRTIPFEGEPIRVAPPEYVIVRKLQFFREGGSGKHLQDIRNMLSCSGHNLDRTVLQEKINQLDLTSCWEKVQDAG